MMLPWLLLAPLLAVAGLLAAWRWPVGQAAIAWAAAAACLGLALRLVLMPEPGPYAVGAWPAPVGIELAADGLSRLMLALTGLVFTAAATYHLGRTLEGAPGTRNPVYHLSFPLLLLALNGLFLTADLFNFYVFFELLAVASYLLVSLGQHAPLEAAWKYSAQSVVGSICLIIGTTLLYGETGALGMAEVASRLDGPAYWAAPFFLAAFLLKGAIFPFHFWQPDAHAAATTAGSVILAGLLIKVGLYGLLRLWPMLMGTGVQPMLLVLGVGSMAFGAVAAWRQADAKRALGFSSVSQVGFVLLAAAWGSEAALAAAIYFLIAHSLAKGLLFLATGALSDRVGSTRLEALGGRAADRPLLAASYGLGALSLVGFPPAAGFVAKLGLLQVLADARAWGWVAVAAVGSFLTLAYAGRLFTQLFWGPAAEGPPLAPTAPAARMAIALLVGALLGAAAAAGPLYGLCRVGAAELLAAPHAPGGPR